MPELPQKLIELPLPGSYSLPDGLGFLGLARPRGAETVRIRFGAKPAKILDIPLSADTLAALASALSPLARLASEELQKKLEAQQEVVFLE